MIDMIIELNTTSQGLITQLSVLDQGLTQPLSNQTQIERKDLLAWLEQTSKIESNNPAFVLITSLRASLLKDLHKSLNPGQKEEETKKAGMSAKAKYTLLALAGMIYFGCAGFDSITTIMGIFSSIPNIALFAAGTIFSVVSMLVFYSFDLVEISKNLGIESKDAPKMVDVLLDEFKQLESIRKRLTKTTDKTRQELEEELQIARMLLQRHLDLDQVRKDLTSASKNPYLKAAKYITAAIAGIIFFSGGYFAGQTVALAIAGLFVATMTATAWPIVVASIVVGLAALSVYWFVERPGIENLISRWRGLDKKKIDKICKKDVVNEETKELQEVITSISSKINSLKQIEEDQERIKSLEKEVSDLKSQKEAALLQVETAGHEVSRLKTELEKIKEQQQTKPMVETTNHEDHAEQDIIQVTQLPHISNEDSRLSALRQNSIFMKKSASTGDLPDLLRYSSLDSNL